MSKIIPAGLALCLAAFAGPALARSSSPVILAKAAVRNAMRDPASAQFRDVKEDGTCDGVAYVHGWANGKNGYGGFGGFKIFAVRVEAGQATVMQMDGQVLVGPDVEKAAAACRTANGTN